ncbi:hypothetical protein N656DRAFT_713149 [Canariomyces notabilis]|uniref:Uncharacterized protein n=1 Tax=Canariomyces notabilis TaxID=2074819 RepID=A0AAN6TA10_9PEZI|nr:hypothetical protein N656DRAFT_713149 [Canariomyces arenarius]
MSLSTSSAEPSIPGSWNDTSQVTVGWTGGGSGRGSIDVLWSCCVTIILCCWVSTFPSVPSLNDKWFHPLVDKFNLACIGFLGPNYLFAIALGQLSSARRSVKLFAQLPHPNHDGEWTLVHGFFADMGGFLLADPDYPPFPVNSEQLYYLVRNGHMDFPSLTKVDIKARSQTDGLSKVITLWQMFWFSVAELQRLREGLPMTTFELTALSFALTMLITSLCWFFKPTINQPTILHLKHGRSVQSIRSIARNSTHPDLPSTWYRTPLDFISPSRRFRIDVHWSYYAQLTYMVHLPLFGREIKTRPWDRLPSDAWLVIDRDLLAPGFVVVAASSLAPLAAWSFYFPTEAEKMAWRACSIYHAAFSIAVCAYYIYVATQAPGGALPSKVQVVYDIEAVQLTPNGAFARSKAVIQACSDWLRRWRNISPDGDPDMELDFFAASLPLVGTFLFICCRLFFYVECFASIRQQPAGVYKAVNKYVPFL